MPRSGCHPNRRALTPRPCSASSLHRSPSKSVYFYEIYTPVASCAKFDAAQVTFSNLRLTSGTAKPRPTLDSFMPESYPCPGWVSLDLCGTTAVGKGPLRAPIKDHYVPDRHVGWKWVVTGEGKNMAGGGGWQWRGWGLGSSAAHGCLYHWHAAAREAAALLGPLPAGAECRRHTTKFSFSLVQL